MIQNFLDDQWILDTRDDLDCYATTIADRDSWGMAKSRITCSLMGLEDAYTGRLMGSFAQELADQYGLG